MRARTKRNLVLGGLAALVGYALLTRPKAAVGKIAAGGEGVFAPGPAPGTAPASTPAAPPVVLSKATQEASARDQLFPASTDLGRITAGAGPLGNPVPLGTNIPVGVGINLHFGDVLRVRTPNTSANDKTGVSRLTRFTIVKLNAERPEGLEGRAIAYEFPDGIYVAAPANTPFVHFQKSTVEGFAYGYVNGVPSVGGGGVGV